MNELVKEIQAFCEAAKMKPGALFGHAGLSRVTWYYWRQGAGATVASQTKIRDAMQKIKTELGAIS